MKFNIDDYRKGEIVSLRHFKFIRCCGNRFLPVSDQVVWPVHLFSCPCGDSSTTNLEFLLIVEIL